MENTRSKLKPRVDPFGKQIKAQQGKEFWKKNTQKSTPEPPIGSGKSKVPNQTGKKYKWSIK